MIEALNSSPVLSYGVIFVFTLLIGSFLNVVILRLPRRLSHEWESQARDILGVDNSGQEAPPDLVFPRSACPHCAHKISPLENIPLISYLALRGKCSQCRQKISARYPVIELLTALLSLALIWKLGLTVQGLWALPLLWALIAASVIDIEHQLLPDNICLPLLWLGLILNGFSLYTDPVSAIFGAAAGYLSLWLVYHLFRLLTGKEGMGYGDFKLLAALGAWLGWQMLPLIILLSSIVGVIGGMTIMALQRDKRGAPIPFGPYLAVAGLIALLWGRDILAWYAQATGL